MMKFIFKLGRRRLQIGALILLALGAAFYFNLTDSVDADDPSQGLFPLAVGKTWVYQVSTEMNDPAIEDMLTISVDRKIEFEDVPTWVRRSADGAEYYIQRDDSGIYRVARRTDVEEQATKDASRRYVLRTPLKVDDAWDGGMTVPYLIRRPNQVPSDLKQSHKAMMTFRVLALNEVVDVPFAKYTKCAHLVGEARIRVFTDPVNGFNDVPLISHEWYCPQVGLVKFSREELVPGQFMTGGKVTYQLIDMHN